MDAGRIDPTDHIGHREQVIMNILQVISEHLAIPYSCSQGRYTEIAQPKSALRERSVNNAILVRTEGME